MTAENQDFKMAEGETKRIVVPESEDEDSGTTLGIGSFESFKWVMCEYEGGPIVVEKTHSDGDITITDSSIGAYEFVIEPPDTENTFSGSDEEFFHYVRIEKDVGGYIETADLLTGTITVEAR